MKKISTTSSSESIYKMSLEKYKAIQSEVESYGFQVVDHNGKILWDESKPDGTPKKLMDSFKLNKMGWKPHIMLEEGIKNTYNWFLDHINTYKQINFN